jgi:predicted nucleic acid-binding protein
MKTPTFVDTSWLLALIVSSDDLHERAVSWQRVVQPPFLTTEYVLVELADALSKDARDAACAVVHHLRNDPATTVVPSSPDLVSAGLQVYEERTDKQWGLTDCISFVVMREHQSHDALTWDHHFEQAGFRALLRLPVPA